MNRFVVKLAAATAFVAATTTAAMALPGPGSLGSGATGNPLLSDVRVFCYNRYSGRFLHWGSCRRRVVRYRYYRPRYHYYRRW